MQPGTSSSLARRALLVTLLALPAAAQQSWSDEFDRPGLLGRVFALGEHQGEFVAGGLTLQGDGQGLGLVAHFDGTHWQPFGTGVVGEELRAVAEFQGELVVGGTFATASGQTVANVARWNGAQWLPLGDGIAGSVFALCVYQGELYAAGRFDEASGQAVANIARWNGAQWQAVGAGLDAAFEPRVWKLEVGPDARLYACGEFTSAGGAPAANIAAWNGASWSALGTGLPGPSNGIVHDIEWFQGELYACANFDLLAGGNDHDKIVAWDGTSWSSAGNFPDSSIGTAVWALETVGNVMYAGGNIVDADGVSVDRFARFDGSQWSFAGGVFGSSVQSTVMDLHELNGLLYAGGEFSQAGLDPQPGVPVVTESVASFDGASWAQVGAGLGFNAQIKDAVLWNGSPVYVGSFAEAGGQVVAGPVRYDGNDWAALGHFSGLVHGAALFQGDLIVVGEFTSIDGQPIVGTARHDGAQWSGFGAGRTGSVAVEYQGELYVGGLGGVERWNGTSWVSFAPQLFGQVLDMHVHNGVLYIGGSMFGTHNLVSYDGTTQQTVGGGTNGDVNALASFGGELLVGGTFTTAGGVAANRLARWNGSTFSAFGGISGTNVDELAIYGGELYASGNLITPGLPANKYVARWDGANWAALGGGLDGPAAALVPDEAGGRLWAAGLFTKADGKPSWYGARWDAHPPEVGSAYCFGDGLGTFCPCGNNAASSGGCANSSGTGARLTASGSTSIGASTLTLRGEGALPNQAALFFQGQARVNAGDGAAFGDGLRCAGQGLIRLQVALPDTHGTAGTSIDIAAIGNVMSGDTRHYQLWYRDPVNGPCGFGFNLSNGLSIAWTE